MRALLFSTALAAGLIALPATVLARQPADHSAHAATEGPAMNHGAMRAPGAPMPAIYMGQADKPGAPVFDGLGDHHHPISTANPTTQKLFDQGVKLLFGFNHAEAIRSFREAARQDPDCAMCWWGVAFALGPNINLPMPEDAVAPAWEAISRAQALKAKASPRERRWIEALAARYSPDPKADRAAMDAAFADAMGAIWRSDPTDVDAGTFYAEAMMDTQPWDYWEADAATPKGRGAEILAVLEDVLAKAPDHPGALHLYIHAVEASTTPERAEAAADRLLPLMPKAGHIVHMPSHIYYRVGRYADAAKANEMAALMDEEYILACKAQGFYPAGYYGHNIHFLWTSAEMEGRRETSHAAARRLVKAVDAEATAADLPLAELFVFTPAVNLLRFGQWREILAEAPPPETLKLDTAMWRYVHGFAAANTGDRATALADRTALAALTEADYSPFDAFGVPAKAMTQVALAMLDGEIARLDGNLDAAIVSFRRAQEIERRLPYTEPAYWHQPVAHYLGAALMQAGRPAEAEAVYRDSLKHYRRDGWALFGLAQALEAQGKAAEAAQATAAHKEAFRLADVTLTSSRF
ncbi:MAG: tetratricopeptide repeat protein [Phenylobacterium sp.]|uniref:tetratricopeptide repeat protein n=1 Tax=Phenylobacterium sp. TaxID=1871053 RepID=UPI00391A8DCF